MRPFTLCLIIVASASALGAQETKSKFGLGTTFNPGALSIPGEAEIVLTQTGFNNILMPIRGQGFTFEPEFGLLRSTTERQIQTGPTTTFTVKTRVSNKRIGLGVLKHLARRDNLEPYFTPRVGFIFASAEEPQGGSNIKTSSTNFYATGGAGAQYFFSDHFTLGGETQLTYTKLGKPKVTGTTFTSTDSEGSSITTLGVIAIRWYY